MKHGNATLDEIRPIVPKATMVESTQELLMLNPKTRISFKYLSKFVKTLTCGFNPETPWKGVNLL